MTIAPTAIGSASSARTASDTPSRSLGALRLLGLLIASTALTPIGAWAGDLPSGGTVVQGTATIATPARNAMTITQSSNRSVVNWTDFSIGPGASVDIRQPGADSAILNRVTGDTRSDIHGRLTSNGVVHVVNPNGIFIGPDGRIDAGGFVASTLNISDSDFMADRLDYRGGGTSADVTNRGRIGIVPGGYAALIGGHVRNDGVIQVPLGRIGLGAGERVTLDLSGDRFLQVTVPSDTTDPTLRALVENAGTIQADGGRVEMMAAAARDAARNVVNMSGVLQARTVSGRSGAIVLGGSGSRVRITGHVDASANPTLVATSPRPHGRPVTGGDITVTGDGIDLVAARLDASGIEGGGRIRIGGDLHGNGPLPTAGTIAVDAESHLSADAGRTGDGGQVVVWAEDGTAFSGTISARGGTTAGNGGFVEVSGKQDLRYRGLTDTRAPAGRSGTLLLDPVNITVPGTIDETTLESNLANGDVMLSTSTQGPDIGDIAINADLDWSASELHLVADNDIHLNGAINGPTGTFSLTATGDVTTSAEGSVDVGIFNLYSGSWRQIGNEITGGLPAFSATDFRYGSTPTALQSGFFLRAADGNGSPGSPYRLTDIYGVQGLDSTDLAYGSFVLADDIDASGTAGWSQGAGFNPIDLFFGALDGGGHAITGLTVSRPGQDVGLFQYLIDTGETRSEVRDLMLSITDMQGLNAGGLAIENQGLVSGVDVTGPVRLTDEGAADICCNDEINRYAGGITARNLGTIGDSTADVNISWTDDAGLGLVYHAGGIAGENSAAGTIEDSISTGHVGSNTGRSGLSPPISHVGGIAGSNFGNILRSQGRAGLFAFSSGALYAGGLAGVNSGIIVDSVAAPPQFHVGGHLTYAGGLVGVNNSNGAIAQSNAAGTQIALTDGFHTTTTGSAAVAPGGPGGASLGAIGAAHDPATALIGGLVGRNDGSVMNSYSLTDLSVGIECCFPTFFDTVWAGGFTGMNQGTITNSFSTGAITVPASATVATLIRGGLIARNSGLPSEGGTAFGTATSSFWDITTSGEATSDGGTGLTTTQFQDTAAFPSVASGWDFANIWAPGEAGDYPVNYSTSPVVYGVPVALIVEYGLTDTAATTGAFHGGPASYVFGPAGDTLDTSSAFASLIFNSDQVGATTFLPVTTSLVSAQGQSYRFVSAQGAADITPAPLMIAALPQSHVYGVALDLGSTDFTTEGLVSGDTVTAVTLSSPGAPASATVGDYAITASDPVGTGLGNYDVSFEPATLTVTPAPLTIRALDQAKPFETEFTFDGTEFAVTGLVPGDSVTHVNLSSSGADADASPVDNPFPIAVGNAVGTGLDQYAIDYQQGAMAVVPTANSLPPPPPPTSQLPGNPSDTIVGGPFEGGGAQIAVATQSTDVTTAKQTLNDVQAISVNFETSLQVCSSSDDQITQKLDCLAGSLDTYARHLGELTGRLPPGLDNIEEIIRNARDGVLAASQEARVRLTTATTEAERRQIAAEAVSKARRSIADARVEIQKAITLIRADEPELVRLQEAQINTIVQAVASAEITLSRAVEL